MSQSSARQSARFATYPQGLASSLGKRTRKRPKGIAPRTGTYPLINGESEQHRFEAVDERQKGGERSQLQTIAQLLECHAAPSDFEGRKATRREFNRSAARFPNRKKLYVAKCRPALLLSENKWMVFSSSRLGTRPGFFQMCRARRPEMSSTNPPRGSFSRPTTY